MTKKEFLEAVVVIEGAAEELVEFAKAELEKMEAAHEATRAKAEAQKSKTLIEAREALAGYIGDVKFTAPDVASALGISTQKASAMLRKLEAAGEVLADKSGKKVVYTRVEAKAEVEAEVEA